MNYVINFFKRLFNIPHEKYAIYCGDVYRIDSSKGDMYVLKDLVLGEKLIAYKHEIEIIIL